MAEISRLTAGAITDPSAPDDPSRGKQLLEDKFLVTKSFVLLSKVHAARGALPEALEALHHARGNQTRAISQLRQESGSADLGAQKEVSADVAMELGALHEQLHDADAALEAYTEALRHHEDHEKAMLSIARLQLARGDVEAAQQQCSALMTMDSDSHGARMMVADIMIQKSEWEAAIYHFEQMLLKNPAQFGAIAKMVSLLRRAGRLEEATKVSAFDRRLDAIRLPNHHPIANLTAISTPFLCHPLTISLPSLYHLFTLPITTTPRGVMVPGLRHTPGSTSRRGRSNS